MIENGEIIGGVIVTINEKAPTEDVGWIKYGQTSYSCEVGQVIDTKITAGGVPNSHVSEYKSSDTSIATIEFGLSNGAVTKCSDCIAVHIICKKKGTVTLTAESNYGATISTNLTVK